ncbi:ArsR/SmtB family transcription factor [Hamadaea tsunoensis]|uniref:ArsR/SmtB family transcription factor n=1 Tax=Hamadaea tsunoensis TaxID=53368 RepID=UPI00041369DB|nr:metalloregulator ArsR/SmtB family transcription factor [Hamadaea tsunoensis]
METNVSDVLGALGDPSRRAIVEVLVTGELSVGQLAERMPISRPAVSQHLKVLKQAGVVVDRAVGTQRVYAVDPAALALARAYLTDFWQQALESFGRAARERSAEEGQS